MDCHLSPVASRLFIEGGELELPRAQNQSVPTPQPNVHVETQTGRYGDEKRVVINSIVSAPAVYGDPGTGVSDAPEPSTNPDTVPLF